MTDPKKDEPTKGEFHNAAVNPMFTAEQAAELEAMTGIVSAEIQEIYERVKAEVEAEQAAAEVEAEQAAAE